MILINLLANILILFGSMFFTIGVFGRKSQKIESMNPIEKLFVKTALVTTSTSALLNCLTLSSIYEIEVFSNIGLGMLFVWAAHFHFKYFVNKK